MSEKLQIHLKRQNIIIPGKDDHSQLVMSVTNILQKSLNF